MLRVRVSTASAEIIETELITTGRRGLECAFEFNSAWDGLAKTVIVNGVVKRDIVLVGDTITVPGECLAREQFPLRIGVYGANGAGEIVIPTIWANFGKILPSAQPSGIDPDEVTPDVVAQINKNSSDALRLAQEVMRRADSGEFDGRDGATGPRGEDGTDGQNGNSIWTTTETPMPATGGMTFTQLAGRSAVPPIVGDIIVRSSRYVYDVVEVTPGGVVIGHLIGDIKGDPGVYVGVTEPTDPTVRVWVDTDGDADDVATETDPTVPAWAKAASKPSYTASEVGALPASTAIPSKTSDLTNDSGFQSETQVESKVADVYPIDTASGSIASFSDGADSIQVKDLTVAIEPVQDLHGYDAPWPAGGGVNLLPPHTLPSVTDQGVTLTNNNGEYTLNGTTGSAVAVFDVRVSLPAGQYTVALNNPTANSKVQIYGIDEDVAVPLQVFCSTANTVATATFSATVKIFRIRVLTNGTVDNFKLSPVFSAGAAAATKFFPYSNICPISGWTGANIHVSPTTDAQDGTTYSITFPSAAGTVYGGTLDVTTGKLTVDMAMADMGTLTWSGWEQGGSFIFYSHISDKMPVRDVPCKSSQYAYNGAITGSLSDLLNGELTGQFGGNNVYVRDARYSSIADFKTAMSGVQLVYPLATPVEYTLTPTEVTTLLGTNNVWADCGDSTVEYRADTKLYIDKKIAAIPSAGGEL